MATHLAAFYNGRVVGTVRIYKDDGDVWWGGRLAVLRSFRGKAGKVLILNAVAFVRKQHGTCFRAFVQSRNVTFFRTLNWKTVGPELLHHGRPHYLMEAELTL